MTCHIRLDSFPKLRSLSSFLILVGFMAAHSRDALSASSVASLAVSASYSSEAGIPVVRFSVKNVSSETISIAEAELPWNARSKTILVIVRSDSGEPLQKAGVIRDYFGRPPTKSLAPGEALTEIRRLSSFLISEKDKAGIQPYILFWHYAPHASDGADLGSYGGWLEFEK